MYLIETDLPRMAQFLGVPIDAFESKYVSRTARHIRLRKPPDRQCHFHRDNKCAIHPVKPVQCRTFPFWPELIESEEAWDEAAAYCPGMGRGELVQIEAATEIASEMHRAYPNMYPHTYPQVTSS